MLVPAAVCFAALKEGDTAPAFTLPHLMDGSKRLKIGEYIGEDAPQKKKAVIISFFASYCKPCILELPELEKLFNKYKDQGLLVVDINIDQANQDKVKEIITKANLSFPVLTDRFTVLVRNYGATQLPKMFIMDGNGSIQMVNAGYSEEIFKKVEAKVITLLGLKPQ